MFTYVYQFFVIKCGQTHAGPHPHTTQTHKVVHTHSRALGSPGPWLCGVLWSEILMQRFKAHTNPL